MGRLIEGKVFDSETNEPLAFAVIAVTDAQGKPIEPIKSVNTQLNGTFALQVDSGEYLGAKYVGYPRMVKPIIGNTDFNFPLKAGYTLNTVTVTPNSNQTEEVKAVEEVGSWNWLIWMGIGVSVLGITMVIVSKVKK